MRQFNLLIIICTLSFISCNTETQDNNVIYIYEGRYGIEVLARIENNRVYSGRYGMEILYSIRNNTVYRKLYETPVYRIEGDFIYDNLYSGVVYRIENNFIYRDRYSIDIVYRIEP